MRLVTFEFLSFFLFVAVLCPLSQLHAIRQKELQVNVFRCTIVRMCWHNFKVHCRQRPHFICVAFNANRVLGNIRTFAVSFRICRGQSHAVVHDRRPHDWRHSIDAISVPEMYYPRTVCAASHRYHNELLAAMIRNSMITRGWPFWSIKVVRFFSFISFASSLLSLSYLLPLCVFFLIVKLCKVRCWCCHEHIAIEGDRRDA